MKRRIDAEMPGNSEHTGERVNRRELIRRLGGGITIFFSFGRPSLAMLQQRDGSPEYPEDFNAYLQIGEDGTVTCFTGKVELGQGIQTSLTQMAAEELKLPLSSIKMVLGDTDRCPYDSGTYGSRTTKYFGPPFRRAAAEARAVLMELASEEMELSVGQLSVQDGFVIETNSPVHRISYARLARGKKIERHLTEAPEIVPYSQHKVCGVPTKRLDGLEKVTGKALFAGDIRPDKGIKHACILRPPAHGAKLIQVDTSEAEKVPGVRAVRDGELVAVLHSKPDVAEKALKLVRAEYRPPEERNLTNDNIFKHLRSSAGKGDMVAQKGELEQGKRLAFRTFKGSYTNHYVAHAPMEPHTALAHFEGDRVTVWASTQSPFRAKEEIAEALGVASEKVRVISPYVGGGFGGKTRNQQVTEAARLSKLTGQPVQVAWSRKEEFFYDTFRPAAVIEIESALDARGRIVLWDFNIFFAGTRSSEPVYEIPNYQVVSHGSWMRGSSVHPFAVGAWRGPGSNTNVFATESQIDTMAAAAGLNSLEFRLRNLTNPRMKKVLEMGAEKFGHSFQKAPSGKGYGVACTDYLGTCVALFAQVTVDEKTGAVKVDRVVCAQDMGEIINPEGARLQIEGCITMGLGYPLTEKVRFVDGKVLDENFDTYSIPRFSWLPEIEVVLVDNPDVPPQGCGEPAITGMGSLIANAIHDATGIRFTELPITSDQLKEALKNRSKS